MPEDFDKEIEDIQNNVEESTSVSIIGRDGIVEGCPLCKHAACSLITEKYYDNDSNIEITKKWFYNKFRRKISDERWTTHIKEHVEPFVKGYVVIRQKKMNDLSERVSSFKKTSPISQTSMIKQMLLELMIDGFVSKKDNLVTKEDKTNYAQLAKTISTLAKSYQSYEQMERDALGLGKTEEEAKDQMKNYMNVVINDMFKSLSDMPEAQERIAELMGIPMPQDGEEGIDIEDVST